ncbi:hypothetical protein ACOSQ2_004309 [Xanthoceras sorbifolium]
MWYLVVLLSLSSLVNGVPQVPCYFIFGASLYDNGNNNALLTTARANYPPYGVDFPGGPTGRFSNGRNTADIIGFDNYVPPFATASGQDILKGVNYASGSSGIHVICIIAMLGTNGSLCVDFVNQAIQLFNARLIPLVDELNKNQDAKFIYLNSYQITMTPTTGFRVTNTPCCEVGGNNTLLLCIPFRIPCQNRTDYMYWDAVHPTEAANVMVAGRSYNARVPSDTYPIDIRRLAQL